ncbi:AAA family ATPase [Peptoniphilus catoniae]|uniref:AAA family ATPase n=1 Tax=Peptoniphilus catoniae TaxID=1660341 RepID=UPI0010FEA7F6|nr:AAA family ATPase [Peptoniphilus catoniae]
MAKIYAKLFGVPQILKNGEKVFFPYAKINALIYYVIINKIVSRDEMAGLLWPDENEKIAKKNLRNALYQAKKCLDVDFIVSPKKSILVLNDQIDIQSDTDIFSRDPKNNLDLYTGDFLQGFFLKEAESYEYWITNNRSAFQDKFTSEAYLKIENDIENENYDNIEQRINRLVQIDEFDERNFRLLMKFYQKTGRNGKVVETYHDLSKLLSNELGVSPDAETKKIYDKSIELINLSNTKKKISDQFFYGRYKEIANIENILNNFKDEGIAKSIYLSGEAGIGKTFLKNKVLKNRKKDFLVIEAFCYQAEQGYSLRTLSVIIDRLEEILKDKGIEISSFWNNTLNNINYDESHSNIEMPVFESKGPLSSEILSQTVIEIIKKISLSNKLIIVIEDMQWMDQTSIKLLTSIMLHLNNEALFFLTSRQQYNIELDNLISSLQRYDKIEKIELSRFDYEDSWDFIKKALPDKEIDEKISKKIYSESEGNTFFLAEYVNLLKSNNDIDIFSSEMMDTLKSRFLYLSKEERDILNMLSFFYDKVDIGIICQLTGQTEFKVIGFLEELEKRNIIKEISKSDNISIVFTHSKLREYIYMVQPDSKKKIIHKKIGEILEEKLSDKKKNPYLYSKLVYHFDKAGELLKAFRYKIETLNYYLSFSHELFPILTVQEDSEDNIYISRDQIREMFESLTENFNQLKSSYPSEELNLIEIEFFYMKGRYLIREGNYEEGLSDIRYVIGKAEEIGERDFVLDSYKQIIFYDIQTNSPEEMVKYIELALDLAVKCNYHKEIGILLRLKGLYNIMVGNYIMAERLLNESITTLTVTKEVADRYSINIAAANNYIGELRALDGDYDAAVERFKKAIELSTNKNALSSLSIFYINLGKTYFAKNEIENAKKYFKLAYSLYGKFDSFWKRTVLDSYMTLTEIKLNNLEEAKAHLLSAMGSSDTMKDPRDLGTLNFALYFIAKEGEKDKTIKEAFKDLLSKEPLQYKEEALKYLDRHRDLYEIKILNA